jgi:nitrite reductase/ring-hydroxylating ferredoxin subunit
MTDTHPRGFLPVASLVELESKGVVVVSGRDRPIAVFWEDGRIFAIDNRCPHLGFPLHRGTVRDGLVTCHWHEARFDLCTGCTFDLWADDVPAFDTDVIDGAVYVAPHPRQAESRARSLRRLTQGLEQEVSLVQAKSILALRRLGTDWIEIIREIARFGGKNHDRWGEGMTLLAIAASLAPHLRPETMYHVVLGACRQVGIDCSDAPARREREPLAGGAHPREQLGRWLRSWVRARHRDASERVLLTALGTLGASPELSDLVFTAASDRAYASTGHVLDGWNKAFELLDFLGWEHAGEVLPLLTAPTDTARGAEEDAHWHHPHELIEPLRQAEAELPEILEAGGSRLHADAGDLSSVLLGEDPFAVINVVRERLRAGVAPAELSKDIAYAAAVRLARFSENNEVADWFNPRHTFIFANAVHQAVKRSPTPGVVRGVFHAALAVYMDRFLNVPPARLPDPAESQTASPTQGDAFLARLLGALDQQSNVDQAALLTAQYLRLGHPLADLVDTLAFAVAREDLDFHAMQVLEAGVRQCGEWGAGPEREAIMIGVVRQLAAFCPTPRAGHRIATTALRLDRGDRMY